MNESTPVTNTAPKTLGTADLKVQAKAEWKGDRLLVTMTIGLEKPLNPMPELPAQIRIALHKDLRPASWQATNQFIFAGSKSTVVMDGHDNVWSPETKEASSDTDWNFVLSRQKKTGVEEEVDEEVGDDAPNVVPKADSAVSQEQWSLTFVAVLNSEVKVTSAAVSVGVMMAMKLDGTGKSFDFNIPQRCVDTKSPAILEATADDTSALRIGQKFELSWKLTDEITEATLHGPISHDTNRKNLFPAKGEPKNDSIEVCVIGPMNFRLIAHVRGENTPIVRAVTVGVLTNARGGRVDVWPRQVLPRGPVALLYTAHQVTSVVFHDVAGDVVDGEIDGAPMPHDSLRYKPSNEKAETNIVSGGATLRYGPRAGQSWSVEAECQPEGDARQLTATVTAVGSRKLPSSLASTEGLSNWSYLACDLVPFKDVEVPKEGLAKKTTDAYASKTKPPFAMAAGRFEVKKCNALSQRSREWVAVATHEGVDVHINKLKDQRSYRLDPAQHTNHEVVLRKALSGNGQKILGIGSAEMVDSTSGDVYRGECIVIVSRGNTDAGIVLTEIEFPLSSANTKLRQKSITHVGFSQIDEVQVVSLWPRLYVFGKGVAYSFDRSGKDETKWNEVQETKLVEVCTPEWRIVAIPAQPKVASSHPWGGFLFALAKNSGRLVRFDVPGTGVISTDYVEMASANGRVAKLHRLRDALRPRGLDKDGKPKSAMALEHLSDGRVIVAKDASGKRSWKPAVDIHSAVVAIGGALLVRSEVHDPRVQSVAARTAQGIERRGMQDRAYHPRLNLWVRCGHPFPSASTAAGALLASTASSLYCWDDCHEISYISPIDASHLGFFPTNMAPMATTDATSNRNEPLSDTLYAGSTKLKEGAVLQSKNGVYRLELKKGVLELSKKDGKGAFSISVWTLASKDPKRVPTFVTLGLDANLVLRDGDLAQVIPEPGQPDPTAITSIQEDEITRYTWFRETAAAERARQLRDIRLVVDDEGAIVCRASRGEGKSEEVLWAAPHIVIGSRLEVNGTLHAWEILRSSNAQYSLAVRNGRFCLLDKKGDMIRRFGPDGAWGLKLTNKELTNKVDIVFLVKHTSDYRDRRRIIVAPSGATPTLMLDDYGDVVVKAGDTELFGMGKTRLSLEGNNKLYPGEYLESPGGESRLQFTDDFRVILTVGGKEVWKITKSAQKGSYLAIRMDGNLVLYDKTSTVIWAAHENGGVCGGTYDGKCGGLRMLPAGFRVVSTTNAPWYKVDNQGGAFPDNDKVRLVSTQDGIWRAPIKDRKTLKGDHIDFMAPGDEIVSPDGKVRLVYEYNGNASDGDAGCLKLIRGSTVLWKRGQVPYGCCNLWGTGIFVLRDTEGRLIWQSVDDYSGFVRPENPAAEPVLSVTNQGELQIMWGDTKIFSSWYVRIKIRLENGEFYLTRTVDNELILAREKHRAVVWQFEGKGENGCFRNLGRGTALTLNFTNASGRVKLHKDAEAWKLQYFGDTKTWSFYSLSHKQYLFLDENNVPWVKGVGKESPSHKQWIIEGGLTPAAIQEGIVR